MQKGKNKRILNRKRRTKTFHIQVMSNCRELHAYEDTRYSLLKIIIFCWCLVEQFRFKGPAFVM